MIRSLAFSQSIPAWFHDQERTGELLPGILDSLDKELISQSGRQLVRKPCDHDSGVSAEGKARGVGESQVRRNEHGAGPQAMRHDLFVRLASQTRVYNVLSLVVEIPQACRK